MKMEDGARLRIPWNAQRGRSCAHNALMVEGDGSQASNRGVHLYRMGGTVYDENPE